jgi:peptidoglycan/LPS O-acetylase OafA/YrhL
MTRQTDLAATTGPRRGRIALATVVALASLGVFVLIPIVAPDSDVAGELIFGAATASFVLVGLLLVVRAPQNRIGTVLLTAGALLAFAYGCDVYGSAGATANPVWPGSVIASVLGGALFVVPIALALVGIPLIFPDGHLISRRWRPMVWLVVVALTVGVTGSLLGPTTATDGVRNPFAVPELEQLSEILGGFASVTSVIGFSGAAAALWVRYRRGSLVERQQLKWLLAVAALAAVFFPIAFIVPVQAIGNAAFILGSLTLVALPLAIAVAILRYRLFEIDRIVSRTLSYAIVTGLLGTLFVGVILLLQTAFADALGGGGIPVAISTLAVFVLFRPLLGRVRRSVDRRFDRARVDGERIASEFAERLRWETDMERVTGDLRTTVVGAVAPKALAIWLRGAER